MSSEGTIGESKFALRRPSRRSVVVAAALSRTIRPLTDACSPRGLQLWALRALTEGIGGGWSPLRSTASRQREAVPGLWVHAPDVPRDGDAILYLHGGGYVAGSPRSHRALAARLSASSGTAVFLPHYRRAPEHPFPAAADDALAAYRALLEASPGRRIALAGDSAGAHLGCTLMRDLITSGEQLPVAALFFSPALDWTGESAHRRDRVRRDPLVSPAFGRKCGHAYLGKHRPDSRTDIMDAELLTQWPPCLIQAGDTECLLGDAQQLAEALTSARVPCELQIWPGQVHVFQGMAGILPEARAAIRYGGRFLAAQLAEAARAA